MRAIFVLLGAATLERYHWVLLIFGGILIYSSITLLLEDDSEDEEDLSDNVIVKFCQVRSRF